MNDSRQTLSGQEFEDMVIAAVGAEKGLSQARIANDFGWGQKNKARVHRLQKKAEGAGIMRKVTKSPWEVVEHRINAKLLKRVREMFDKRDVEVRLSAELTQQFSDVSRKSLHRIRRVAVFVVDLGVSESAALNRFDKHRYKAAQEAWGRKAGVVLGRLLLNSHVIFTAWGTTCRLAIDHLILPQKPTGTIDVFPMRGESFRRMPVPADSPARVAGLLASRLRASTHSLTCVPPFIPNPEFTDAWTDFLVRNPFYTAAFGCPDGDTGGRRESWIKRADTLISSLSCAGDGLGAYTRDVIKEGLQGKNLHEIAVGDVAGILLPTSDATKDECDAITERFLGIRSQDFSRCAKSANSRRPGVILLAFGSAQKADVLIEVLKLGINTIITTRTIAERCRHLLKSNRLHTY